MSSSINRASRSPTNGGTDSVNSITSQDPIALGGGTLSITSASTITEGLTISNATLDVTGDLAVDGLLTLQDGTTLSGNGGGGSYGGLAINPLNALYLEGTALTNHAAATWQFAPGLGNQILLSAGTTIDNLAGASFTASGGQANGSIVGQDGSAVAFDNAGAFTRRLVAGNLSVAAPFANTGTVALAQGTLYLSGTGATVSTGSFSGSAGTGLTLNGQVLTAASTISCGTVAITNSSEAGGFRAAGGSYAYYTDFTGPILDLGPAFEANGVVTFDPAAGGPVTLSTTALTLDTSATLGGTDSFAVAGLLTLNDQGRLDVPVVNAEGGLQINPLNALFLEGTTLNNHAAATWQSHPAWPTRSSSPPAPRINNLAGASFHRQRRPGQRLDRGPGRLGGGLRQRGGLHHASASRAISPSPPPSPIPARSPWARARST